MTTMRHRVQTIVCVIFFSFNYTKNGLNSHLISQRIDLT